MLLTPRARTLWALLVPAELATAEYEGEFDPVRCVVYKHLYIIKHEHYDQAVDWNKQYFRLGR